MIPLLAIGLTDLAPFVVFAAIVAGAWFLMIALSQRTSAAEERLDRLGPTASRPADLGDLDTRRSSVSAG